jgi:hypothetical protein
MQDLADGGGGSGSGYISEIDDTITDTTTAWSSNKIDSEITSEINDADAILRGGYNGTLRDLAEAAGITIEEVSNNNNRSVEDSENSPSRSVSSGSNVDDTVTDTDSTWSSSKITSEIGSAVTTNINSIRGGYTGSMYDLYIMISTGNSAVGRYGLPYVDLSEPRCILTVNGETVTSDYGYTLDLLHNILNSDDNYNYIKNGDYIRLIANNADIFDMEFNIDPYYSKTYRGNADIGCYGITSTHHIDMISKDLIPNASWRMRASKTNTGTSSQKDPYLAYNEPGYVKANLADYYTNNIPDILKNYIIKKQLVVPYRSSGNNNFTGGYDINGAGFEEMPELWIPFMGEKEPYTAAYKYEARMSVYYTLSNYVGHGIKRNESNTATQYWLASTFPMGSYTSGSSPYYFYSVNASGSLKTAEPNTNLLGVPLCFRFI